MSLLAISDKLNFSSKILFEGVRKSKTVKNNAKAEKNIAVYKEQMQGK